MIPDDETMMAYADGQLDPIAAKRVEQAIAGDPALAMRVARERALRERLAAAFAPVAAEPVPAALTAPLATNVVPLPVRTSRRRRWWVEAAAIAATLVLGAIGRQRTDTPLTIAGGRLAAQGALRGALDGDLSGGGGRTRLVASFRTADSRYCRIFAIDAVEGIACRDGDGWTVVRTQSARHGAATAYAQAGSAAGEVMAAAQDMMAGEPLDRDAERDARDRRWR